MADMLSRRPLWIAAAVTVIAGILLTAASAMRIRSSARTIREYAGYTAQLQEVSKSAWRGGSAIRVFEAMENPHPAPMADILKEVMPGQKYDAVEQPSQPTIPGWTVRRIQVSFVDVQLVKLGEFLSVAESRRPPWRMVSCRIRATSAAGGTGQATLILESMDKTP